MNNDLSPGSSARQRAPPPDLHDASNGGGSSGVHPDETGESSSAAAHEDERKQRQRAGRVKKLKAMTHLHKGLDMVVFAYICTLYYMECSFSRLLLRVIPHYIFITPKEGAISLPAHRPHVFAVFLPNFLCMLFHCIFALPEAGEAMRGYLHGGILIDFIGQRPPTWRLGLLLFDLIIWGVQCLMLAVHVEREPLRKLVDPSLRPPDGIQISDPPRTMAEAIQDLDAEERGVLRGDATGLESSEGIEMQPLNGTGSGEEPQMDDAYSRSSADLVDIMWSGDAVLANFHVVHAVKTVGNDLQSAAAYTLQGLGYGPALAAAIAAERRAGLATRLRATR